MVERSSVGVLAFEERMTVICALAMVSRELESLTYPERVKFWENSGVLSALKTRNSRMRGISVAKVVVVVTIE